MKSSRSSLDRPRPNPAQYWRFAMNAWAPRSPPAVPSTFPRHTPGKSYAGRPAKGFRGAGRGSSYRQSHTRTRIARVDVASGRRVTRIWHRCRSCRRHHGRPRIRGPGSQTGSDAHRPNRRRFAIPRGVKPLYCRYARETVSKPRGLCRAGPLGAGRSAVHDDRFPPWGEPTLVRRKPPTSGYSPSWCAPLGVHLICCFLTNRLLTTCWLTADSTNPVAIGSPCR
jgi:hypothetical protein